MIRFVGTLALVSLLGPVFGFAADNKACGLLTEAGITAKSRAGMVPIEKLHPLAEKMAGRF